MARGKESSGQARRRIGKRIVRVAKDQMAALDMRDTAKFRELESELIELRCELEGWLAAEREAYAIGQCHAEDAGESEGF